MIAATMVLVLAGSAPPAQVSAVVEQPRQTGYFVGDLLTQRVLLDSTGRGLSPTTLPNPGRVSAWFERRKITLETDSSSRHWLSVQYQILNAPQKLTIVNLPAWTLPLKAAAGGPGVVLKIPPSPINVAPLSPPGSPTQVGVADLRPDRLAPLVPLAPLRRAVTLSVSALALTLLTWLGWLLWRNHRAAAEQPFARALRELRALDDREPRAWQILHRAFDRTAGRVIQTATLPELFERAPQLTPAREQIERFFAQSSALFYAAPAPAQGPAAPAPAQGPAAPALAQGPAAAALAQGVGAAALARGPDAPAREFGASAPAQGPAAAALAQGLGAAALARGPDASAREFGASAPAQGPAAPAPAQGPAAPSSAALTTGRPGAAPGNPGSAAGRAIVPRILCAELRRIEQRHER